jgi:hypothetical protein
LLKRLPSFLRTCGANRESEQCGEQDTGGLGASQKFFAHAFSPQILFPPVINNRYEYLMRRILGAAWVPTRISRVFLHLRQCKSGYLSADLTGLNRQEAF